MKELLTSPMSHRTLSKTRSAHVLKVLGRMSIFKPCFFSLPRDRVEDTDHPGNTSSHTIQRGGMDAGMRVPTQTSVEPNFPSTQTRDEIQGLGEAKQGERQATDLNPSRPSPSSSSRSMGPSLEQRSHTHTLPLNDQGVRLESHAQSMTTALCEEVVVQHMIAILDARRGFTVQSWDQGQVHPGLVNFLKLLGRR